MIADSLFSNDFLYPYGRTNTMGLGKKLVELFCFCEILKALFGRNKHVYRAKHFGRGNVLGGMPGTYI